MIKLPTKRAFRETSRVYLKRLYHLEIVVIGGVLYLFILWFWLQ